jgi:aspartyl-tRNA(Asn)/glutamyl-tRNA(Gln) amidotransferase subunit C
VSKTTADPLRPDELRECLPHEAAMAGAPQSDGTFFRVPKVIER